MKRGRLVFSGDSGAPALKRHEKQRQPLTVEKTHSLPFFVPAAHYFFSLTSKMEGGGCAPLLLLCCWSRMYLFASLSGQSACPPRVSSPCPSGARPPSRRDSSGSRRRFPAVWRSQVPVLLTPALPLTSFAIHPSSLSSYIFKLNVTPGEPDSLGECPLIPAGVSCSRRFCSSRQ